MTYQCTSKHCRSQTIQMVYLKGAYLGVVDTCRLELFKCTHTKTHYNFNSSGGVSLAGSAIAPNYAFYDSFTGTGNLVDHAPEIGSAWTQDSGIITLSGGLATFDHTGPGRIIARNDFGIANATINIWCNFDPEFNSGMTFEFNQLDDNNHWAVYHSPPGFALFEHTNGSQVERANWTGTIGYSSMNLRIVTNGDTIQVFKDNTMIFNYTVLNRPNKNYTKFNIDWFKTTGYFNLDRLTVI